MCRKLAEKAEMTVVGVYEDRAISGRSDKRPGFQRMMRDAANGMFDCVIAWKSNRMGRNMLEAMMNDSTLQESGIRCIYVEEEFDDTAAGRFALRSMMNVNQFYSEAMAEDVRRGMMDNARKCMVNGRMTFGFRKGADGRYEIDTEQAEIVREIFRRVRDGWRHSDIMTDLNRRGIRNRDGKPWQRTTFDKLLRNEQYIGVYRFAGVRIEGGIPQIVDRELFEEVQHVLATKKHPRGRHRSIEDYLLTGKLFCGECGNAMVGICGTSRNGTRHHYYLCQGKHHGECGKKNERKEELEQKVADVLRKIILDEKTIDWIVDGYGRFVAEMRGMSALTAKKDELAETDKAIGNILKAVEAGLPFSESTRERMIELEERKKELTAEIEREERMVQDVSPDQIRFVIERYRDRNLDDREYLRELLNTFVRAIFVYDDRFRIVLRNGLGDDIEIPLEVLDEDESVRISDTQGHHNLSVRTSLNVRRYGVVVEVRR